jgi:hypothetical protein
VSGRVLAAIPERGGTKLGEQIRQTDTHGTAAVNEKTRSWFDGYASDIGYEVHELQVRASGDVGFCWFVYYVSGTLQTGEKIDMWVRATLGCQRIDGEWQILHDHESVPFDPATGQAEISPRPRTGLGSPCDTRSRRACERCDPDPAIWDGATLFGCW